MSEFETRLVVEADKTEWRGLFDGYADFYCVIMTDNIDSARLNMPGEEFFRSRAESVLRAVHRASPLQDLPPEKYEQWREITFRFRPPV